MIPATAAQTIGPFWHLIEDPAMADLTRFGIVDDGTLTCQLHGWKFDLASGKCLTSVGHQLRARPADAEVPATTD